MASIAVQVPKRLQEGSEDPGGPGVIYADRGSEEHRDDVDRLHGEISDDQSMRSSSKISGK